MLETVFILPVLMGMIAFFLPATWGRRLLVLGALSHFVLSLLAFLRLLQPGLPDYFALSPSGLLVLLVTSFLFLMVSFYTLFYMAEVEMSSEPLFNGSLLLFVAAMSMVAVADHLIVLWIAVEATTLASAPLIMLHRSKGALEASWKYVLICSVGIALALLGAFFIALAMERGQVNVHLTYSALTAAAAHLDPVWLKAGFIFTLIGYGTKMGLAPMHTWLPDAHSEAPSPVSAILSGALLNCAFLGIFKSHVIMHAAGLGAFADQVLIAFGLLSILVAGFFIINQDNYKRMLAYSSIENMGVIAVGTGIGGIAAVGAMLHLIHHSLLKSSLFLESGNILLGYGTKLINKTGNMCRYMPKTMVAFLASFAGISGLPPFGLFLSEFFIILGALQTRHFIAGGLFAAALLLVFCGVARHVLHMSFAPCETEMLVPERAGFLLPPYMLLLASLLLCFWMPPELYNMIRQSVAAIGGIHG